MSLVDDGVWGMLGYPSRICGWNLLAGGGVQPKALMNDDMHAPEDTDKGGQTQLQMTSVAIGPNN